MRITNYFLVLFIFSVFLTSCKKQKEVIGFMLPHMSLTRYKVEKEVFSQRASELGAEVFFMSADNDENKQIAQFDELLKKGITLLVLDPVNRFNAGQMVRKAHEQGIKVISYDRLISNCEVDAYVTFDAMLTGKQMTEYALKEVPKGDYMVLGGDKTDINAIGIRKGQQQTLEPAVNSGAVKIVYTVLIEKWSADDAAFEVKRYVNLTQRIPDVILASSDALAKGCIKALNDLNITQKVLITGNGGEAFACKSLLTGKQSMTVYKPVKKLATLAAELAIKMNNNENVSQILNSTMNNGAMEVPSCLLNTIVVDSSAVRSIIVADGMVSEADLK